MVYFSVAVTLDRQVRYVFSSLPIASVMANIH